MIKVTVDDRLLQRRFTRLAAFIGDRAVVNTKIAIRLYRDVQTNFQDEGVTVTGQRWPDLKLGYRVRVSGRGKRRTTTRQTDYKLLQDTGQLRQSFIFFADRDMAGTGAKRVAWSGKRRPWDLARIHQEGLGNMPQREMLPRKEKALEYAIAIYGDEISKSLRSEGY